MPSFFSSLQQYAGAFAVGAVIAKVVGDFQATMSDNPGNSSRGGNAPHNPGEYKPTPIDVIVVRVMLEKGIKLPLEILDLVFDQAEYWPHSEAIIEARGQGQRNAIRVVGTTPDENKLLIRCPPIGFLDYRKVGEAFKTAPLPPKSVDGSALSEPIQNLTLMEPALSPTEPTQEAPREYFSGSMKQPPTLTHPVRKIVFKIRSKDQGWGGAREHVGTYHGSWSWFEAGLEKFDQDRKCDGSCDSTASSEPHDESNPEPDVANFCTCGLQSVYPPVVASRDGKLEYHHDLNPIDNLKIQCNKTADRVFLDYEVVWAWTDDIHPDSPEGDHLEEIGRGRGTGTGNFVRSLKLGDVMTVWGKARFGGWCNYVESLKVEIYWAM